MKVFLTGIVCAECYGELTPHTGNDSIPPKLACYNPKCSNNGIEVYAREIDLMEVK